MIRGKGRQSARHELPKAGPARYRTLPPINDGPRLGEDLQLAENSAERKPFDCRLRIPYLNTAQQINAQSNVQNISAIALQGHQPINFV